MCCTNDENTKDIFSIVRHKRNNLGFYLFNKMRECCLIASPEENSIKMELNTLHTFVHSQSIFINQYYKLCCKFIKLQYTVKYSTLRETIKNALETTWLLLGGEGVKRQVSKRGRTVQETSVLCYRNLHCDRNLVFEDSRPHNVRHTHTHTHPLWLF